MAEQYPELEATPPRAPSDLARIFSFFPLVTLPPAVSSIEVVSTPTRPVLYVAPGHPRAASSSAGPSTSTTWTSSDVRCLRRQADLTFRGIDFEVDQISSQEAWGPRSSRNTLPFLHLPSGQRGTPVASSDRLLGDDGLLVWAENNGPLPFERKEDGDEKRDAAAAPFASEDVKQEALVWSALLENGLMAAVLLAQLSSNHDPSSSITTRPLFSQFLESHLSSARQAREIHKIHALHTCSSPPTSLSRWTSSIPGMSFQWVGLGASTGGGNFDSEEDGQYLPAFPEGWDEEGIVEEGCRALEAVAARMKEDVSSSWFLGASHPTSLDSLLFAQLHTLLSLGKSSGTAHRLRETILSHEVLTQWTKKIYDEYIKPKETAWRH